jgi:hypothetical protein
MKLESLNSLSNCAFNTAYYEVLGNDGQPIADIKSAEDLSVLCNRLSSNFNPSCACGLAQQIGRSAFTHLVRSTKGMNELSDQSFRLLPAKQRLLKGMAALENLVKDLFGIPVQVVDDTDTILLETSGNGAGHELIPYLETGFIQEYTHWVCGGKPHPVSLNAQAPGWSIQIGKQPLES